MYDVGGNVCHALPSTPRWTGWRGSSAPRWSATPLRGCPARLALPPVDPPSPPPPRPRVVHYSPCELNRQQWVTNRATAYEVQRERQEWPGPASPTTGVCPRPRRISPAVFTAAAALCPAAPAAASSALTGAALGVPAASSAASLCAVAAMDASVRSAPGLSGGDGLGLSGSSAASGKSSE